jgi:hypothetical protein
MHGLAMETPILSPEIYTQGLGEFCMRTGIYHQSILPRHSYLAFAHLHSKNPIVGKAAPHSYENNQSSPFRTLILLFYQTGMFCIDDVFERLRCSWDMRGSRELLPEANGTVAGEALMPKNRIQRHFFVQTPMIRYGVCLATWTNKPLQDGHERDFVFYPTTTRMLPRNL